MRHNGRTHPYEFRPFDGKEGLRRASRDAGEIFAEIARNLIRKNHRRTVLLMEYDRSMRACLHTIIALRATIEKQRLLDSAGRPQPVLAEHRRRLVRNSIFMFGKFLCGFRNRDDRIFE